MIGRLDFPEAHACRSDRFDVVGKVVEHEVAVPRAHNEHRMGFKPVVSMVSSNCEDLNPCRINLARLASAKSSQSPLRVRAVQYSLRPKASRSATGLIALFTETLTRLRTFRLAAGSFDDADRLRQSEAWREQ
jgi:hypothetical protein